MTQYYFGSYSTSNGPQALRLRPIFYTKNIMGSESNNEITAYIGLGADINKPTGKDGDFDSKQGIVSAKLPELELTMTNEEISNLTQKWEKSWTDYPERATWEKKCDDNEKYWLGQQFDTPKLDKTRPNVDNMIFESVETYLPLITRRNPEPLVMLGKKEAQNAENQAYVTKVKGVLGDLADTNKLRLKLKRTARHWAVYMLGANKYGWDLDKDVPMVQVIRAKKLILDPEAIIDEDGYHGKYIGERRKLEAAMILKVIGDTPDSAPGKKVIEDKVGKDTATEIAFIEWWTPQYMCWTLGKEVLLKKKNPHWNYDTTVTGPSVVDTYGNETPGAPTEVKGKNHFPVPKIPYEFLIVFSLDDQPMEKTNLINQNLANQDRINKRNKQIDRNADNMNDGMVVSLERSGLTESQAKNVSAALRKGGVIAIPAGSPQDAIYRPASPGLPADVFNDLVDTRNRVRDIFGTRGSTPSGVGQEKTVRGKYVVKDLDTDRIGGGVSEYLEQLADSTYNWWYQLLLVYDEDFQNPNAPKLILSVKEGSLLPQDTTTIANQAVELSTAGKMSTLDLYKKLEYANPEEMAANVWLEANAPEILYAHDPRVAQVMAQRQAAAAAGAAAEKKPPSESINFKDLPAEGKIQMADQAGIKLTPEAVVAQEAKQDAKDAAKAEKKSPVAPAGG